MKDFFIADAASFEGQSVTTFFLIASVSLRDRKPSAGGSSGNASYLALTLADKSGQFEARMWEDFADAISTCAAGCYVKVQGTVSKYQGKFQITLTKLRLAAATEIDTADFIPTSQYDIPTMARELRGYVAAFRNPHLRRLVLAFLDDPIIGPAFTQAPAAKRLHHAWIGGLLEHVLCLVRVCLATAPFYPEVDPDLLVTGAILHDIGKVRELSWASSFDYTLEGQLIGHISIAQRLLDEKIAQLNAEAAVKSEAGMSRGLQAAESASEKQEALALDLFTTTGLSFRSESALPPIDLSSRPESALPPIDLSSRPESALPPTDLSSRPESALPPTDLSSRPESALPPNDLSSRPESALPPNDLSSRPESALFADAVERPASETTTAAPFPPRLRLLLEHMILSHHGKLEFGSPKLPMTPEAMLLSALDDLEAKFQTLRNEFAAAKSAARPAGDVTEWVRSMERPLFNSQAWLASNEKQ